VEGRTVSESLAENGIVTDLEHVERAARTGAVGTEAHANALADHVEHAVRREVVIVERAVADGDIMLGEEIDVGRRDENGVGGVQALVEDADFLKIGGRTEMVVVNGVVDLVGPFREVGVEAGVEFIGEMRHADTKLFGIDQNLAQGEPGIDARMIFPAFDQGLVFTQGLPGGHDVSLGQRAALAIHVAGIERDSAADADFLGGTAHFVRMRSAGLKEAGGAGADHGGVADEAAKVDVVGLKAALERNQRLFPGGALPIGGSVQAAKKLLSGVVMGVGHAGHRDLTGGVDRAAGLEPRAGLGGFAHPENGVALDGDGSIRNHSILIVEGDDVGAEDEEIDGGGWGIYSAAGNGIRDERFATGHLGSFFQGALKALT
jgi:hypothetical protein